MNDPHSKYALSAWYDRDLTRERHRHDSDIDAARGPLGGIILHLRRRAGAARLRAGVFLAVLVVTVLFGLTFYLGLPFWQIYADGSIRALETQVQALDQQDLDLDAERALIVTNTPGPKDADQRQGLVQELEGMPERVATGLEKPIAQMIRAGDSVLVIDEAGNAVATTDGGNSFFPVEMPDTALTPRGAHFYAVLGNEVFFIQSSNQVFRWTSGEPRVSIVYQVVTEDAFKTAAVFEVTDQSALIEWANGSLSSWNAATKTFSSILVPKSFALREPFFFSILPFKNGALLLGDFGKAVVWTEGMALTDSVDMAPRVQHKGSPNIQYREDQARLATWADGLASLSLDGGRSFRVIPSANSQNQVEASVAFGQIAILLFTNGKVERWKIGTDVAEDIPAPQEGALVSEMDAFKVSNSAAVFQWGNGRFSGTTDAGATFHDISLPLGVSHPLKAPLFVGRLDQGALFIWSDGMALRWTEGSSQFDSVDIAPGSNVAAVDTVSRISNGRILIRFLDGSASVYSGAGRKFSVLTPDQANRMNWNTDSVYWPLSAIVPESRPIPVDEIISRVSFSEFHDEGGQPMLLSTGGSSDIYLLPRDDLSARFAALTLQAGEAGDRTLWDALKENPDGDLKDGVGIPNYIAEWPPIADFIDRLRGFPAVRATIKQQKEGVKARIAALSNSWATIISGSKAGQNLADFLITCRGPVANLQSADVSVTTKTCLEAYEKEQERAGGVWWSTLSRQIPAGVLLMFLLVTLGGLYRYNLRLAAFHDSRADVVQMVVFQTTPDQVRALMQGNPGEIFNRLALAFGAEKLDAGAMRVKLAEAEIQLAETAARLEAANS